MQGEDGVAARGATDGTLSTLRGIIFVTMHQQQQQE